MRSFFLCIVLVLSSITAFAQDDYRFNRDDWKVRFGFLTGANRTILQKTPPGERTGFSMGVGIEYRLSKKIILHPHFLASFLSMKHKGETAEGTIVEFPFHILIKPIGRKIKPTLSFGPNYKPGLASQYGNWFADLALGFEKQLEYFTLAPELRCSYGRSMQTLYFILNFRG